MRTDDTYMYDALYEPDKMIRLVKILSITPRITCKIEIVSLDNSPVFSALSYMWGDASVTSLINVNGKSLRVTTNLVDAIRGACNQGIEGGQEQWLWADAICIDQKNIKEKNHQVPLMGRIYSEARRVFSWIGTAMDASGGIEAINQISGEIAKQPCCESITRQLKDGVYPHGPEGADLKSVRAALNSMWPNDSRSQDPEKMLEVNTFTRIVTLFQSPYWRRLWIFQEVALARESILLCGTTKTSWKDVCTVLFWAQAIRARFTLHDRPEHVSVFEWMYLFEKPPTVAWNNIVSAKIAIDVRRKAKLLNLNPSSFMAMDTLAFDYQATNPKDYVYALAEVTGSRVDVDYSAAKTVAQTYQDYVAHWLLVNQAESKLGPDRVFRRSGPMLALAWFFEVAGIGSYWDTFPGLPSWAPNFAGVVGRHRRNPGGNRIAQVASWRSDLDVFNQHSRSLKLVGSVLNCTAVIIEQVVVLGPVIDQVERLVIDSSPESDMWMLWMFDWAVKSTKLYSNGKTMLYAMFRAMLYGAEVNGREPSKHEFEIFIAELEFVCERRRGITHSEFFTQLRMPTPATDLTIAQIDLGKRWKQRILEAWIRCGHDVTAPTSVEANIIVLTNARRSNHQLRMALTNWGTVGIFPPLVAEGDLVCVINGSPLPVVLRRSGHGYVLVGACYVNGLTKGEAGDLLRNGFARIEDINIF